ncbi:sulfite exporter TauE/SafE family protein [Candidatus Daviesbacteria bacterium]|nr:sulfite exporter TauE/SafE family protein [Candidatus Daviesbacteria bacterium]
MDLWVVFLTGLTVGGLTCMAVQGGLLASILAAREEQDFQEGSQRKHNVLPILAFLTTKFIAYTVLGFVLGAFGGAIGLSDNARVVMQLIAGIYMLAIALNLLNIHPIFRYAVIQPPRFLTRLVRNTSKSKDLFAPAFLGAMTIFIPCGTTLAMEAFAISSGNALLGAAIMAVFILGTSPLFFGLGFLTTTLGDTFRTRFFKVAGVLVFYLGITSVNAALIVAGSPITLKTLADASPIQIDFSGQSVEEVDSNVSLVDGVQTATINVYPAGYSPNRITVKAGIPVKLNLATVGGYGCTSAFVIPQLGISKRLSRDAVDTVEFTPSKQGKITWTCSMGMYYGMIEVI